MLTFRYVARERNGAQVSGTLTAASLEEATRELREKSLFPVSVEKSRALLQQPSSRKRVKARVLSKFYSQMSDLLNSGVPLLKSLDIIRRQSSNPRLSEVLEDIRKRIADGQTIADAMNAHIDVFGELAVSMVRAGQEGGFLEDVFKRISIFTDRQEDLRGRVIGAMAYPLFLTTVGFLVISVLLIFFVPKFATIFDRLRERGELPAATETLLATSQALQDYGLFLLATLGVFFYWANQQVKTPRGRRLVDGWKLRMPLLGGVFRDLAITRFNRVLGTMRKNGIPILQALRIAKDSTGNVLMKEAIDRAADNVQSGDKLATPLRASGCFPLEIVEMIEVAEESNTLEEVLLSSADSLESQTTRQLELAVRFLEPMLLLVMAAVTLVVVVSLLLPIFKMSSAVG
ncbi:MAG: type II secretion system F family protein [Planctomycetota bacterium]